MARSALWLICSIALSCAPPPATPETGTESRAAPPADSIYYVNRTDGLDLRETPYPNGSIIVHLPFNTPVILDHGATGDWTTVAGRPGRWAFVMAGKQMGWAFTGDLRGP